MWGAGTASCVGTLRSRSQSGQGQIVAHNVWSAGVKDVKSAGAVAPPLRSPPGSGSAGDGSCPHHS